MRLAKFVENPRLPSLQMLKVHNKAALPPSGGTVISAHRLERVGMPSCFTIAASKTSFAGMPSRRTGPT
jgi:hypothetical protein